MALNEVGRKAIRGAQAQEREMRKRVGLLPGFTQKYKNPGDVAQYGIPAGASNNYSPGDWARWKTARDKFVADPDADRWKPVYTDGGATTSAPTPTNNWLTMRDASIYAYLTNDTATLDMIRNEILAQMAYHYNSGTDGSYRLNFTDVQFYTDSSKTKGKSGDDGIGFHTAAAYTRLLECYINAYARFNDSQRTTTETVFDATFGYVRKNYDPALDAYFSNRSTFTLTSSKVGINNQVGTSATVGTYSTAVKNIYWGGPVDRHLPSSYNNRKIQMAFSVLFWGVASGNQTFIDSGVRYMQEHVVFSLFPKNSSTRAKAANGGANVPAGALGDYERSNGTDNPSKGLAYSAACISYYGYAMLLTLMYNGDTRLRDFTTRAGANESVVPATDPPKKMKDALDLLIKLFKGTVVIYDGDSNSTFAGDKMDFRDDRTPGSSKPYILDIIAAIWEYALGTTEYQNDYMRLLAGSTPYPQTPKGISDYGSKQAWSGNGAIVDSIPLRFFGMSAAAPWNVLAPPTNLALTSPTSNSVAASANVEDDRATGYVIQSSTDGTTWTDRGTLSATGTSITGTATGLTGGTNYQFRIKASGPNHLSGGTVYSNPKSQSTTGGTPAPASPSNLTAFHRGKTKVYLTWTDNSLVETSFRIEKSDNGGSWTSLATVAANVITYLDTTYAKGSKRQYRIIALNGLVESQPSNTAEINLPAGPRRLNDFMTASGTDYEGSYSHAAALQGDVIALANRFVSLNNSLPKSLIITPTNGIEWGYAEVWKGRYDGPVDVGRNSGYGLFGKVGETVIYEEDIAMRLVTMQPAAPTNSPLELGSNESGQVAMHVEVFDEAPV